MKKSQKIKTKDKAKYGKPHKEDILLA